MTEFMVSAKITKPDQYLKEFMDVMENLGRGFPPGIELSMTYMDTNTTRMWQLWDAESKEALEKFYRKFEYLTIEIHPVDMVSIPVRTKTVGRKRLPQSPLAGEAVEALDRIRDDLELLATQIAKSIKK